MDVLQIIGYVVTFVIGSVAVVGVFAAKFGGITKELGELFITLSAALEDKSITKEELKDIVEEAKDVLEAFKK